MTHRLNTNKQFMIGNGILAFAVIFVVVLFVYMSMRLQMTKTVAMPNTIPSRWSRGSKATPYLYTSMTAYY